jgi:PAS domain S-box-containing protein
MSSNHGSSPDSPKPDPKRPLLPDVSVFTAIRDRSGNIIDFLWSYANAGASAMTGYTQSDLIGHTFLEVLPDHGPAGMFEVCRNLVETGDPYEESTLWSEEIWSDGSSRPCAFDVRATKVHDGFVVVTRDVTELREQSDRLAQLEAERQGLLDLKNEFVEIVAHDLRTPLTVADGFANLLVDTWDELTEDARVAMVRKIQSSIGRLGNLANDVLEVARIESGTFTFDIAPFDLEELVRATVDETSSVHTVQPFEVHVEPGLPSAVGDRDRLWRVLTNLISNALKYSPEDAAILVSLARTDDYLRVSVADQGPGISSSNKAKLFQKFSRIPSASGVQQPKGTGLGLFISKSFVEGLGGTISVESTPGSGSTFAFTVPIGTEKAA